MASRLKSVINHIAFPPKLPDKLDEDLEGINDEILLTVLHAVRIIREVVTTDLLPSWESLRYVLQTCKDLNTEGKLKKSSLLTEFRILKSNDTLILHVTEQNAGLLIQRKAREESDNVIFEAFEASATSEMVIAATDVLSWQFPGSAVSIPYSTFADPCFQDPLATFLEQASTESVKRFAAHSDKGQASVFESRDTTNPALITEMLMTLLEAYGERISPSLIHKHVRDDVCWGPGAKEPWRRSPFWMVIRIGLARHLRNLHGHESGAFYYKVILCQVMSVLLVDGAGQLDLDLLSFLKAKLGRRLAKLEDAFDKLSPSIGIASGVLLKKLESRFLSVMDNSNAALMLRWEKIRAQDRKIIPSLPRRADESHLNLTLFLSQGHLQKVLSHHKACIDLGNSTSYSLPPSLQVLTSSGLHLRKFAPRYHDLAKLECDTELLSASDDSFADDAEVRCGRLATELHKYLQMVLRHSDEDAELWSIMILTVMDLWMMLDRCTTRMYPLLLEYHPGILATTLDVLLLTHREDYERLQKIQTYLRTRIRSCKHGNMTIFSDPAPGCFAEQYFNSSADSAKLHALQEKIEAEAKKAKQSKYMEWQESSDQFRQLQQEITTLSCIYKIEDDCKIHNDQKCTRCFLRRKARRMEIQVHEHPLPANPVHMKAVIFELSACEVLRCYRNITWQIFFRLANQDQMTAPGSYWTLKDYSALPELYRRRISGISLASTEKSFLDTHYRLPKFPVEFREICVPNPLQYRYLDPSTGSWTGRQLCTPSFAHHCQIPIPENSPFIQLRQSAGFKSAKDDPTSYAIMANQTKCPPGLNLHEFMSYQALACGRNRRWLTILTELGSSNLNFSMEATAALVSYLAMQAGPDDGDNHCLRTVHKVLLDEEFYNQLAHQIETRLDFISGNFREVNCMSMLLTVVLQLCSLAPECNSEVGGRLLRKIRKTTLHWTERLRKEISDSKGLDYVQKCSEYALFAALLCQHTFAIYAKRGNNRHSLSASDLRIFLECSITVQENLTSDPQKLPKPTKIALIRNIKLVHRVRDLLRQSFLAHPEVLGLIMDRILPHSGERTYSTPHLQEQASGLWITSEFRNTRAVQQQVIHLHLFEGYLLVNHQPIATLPPHYRNAPILEKLFGTQNILTYPSDLPRMTYRITMPIYGHEIHVGFRESCLIVQARHNGAILEYIPPETFGDAENFDLPTSMVQDCVHWLDTQTGILYIRQCPDIWFDKPGNWTLDVSTRSTCRRTSRLVDPRSDTFRKIAKIFDGFEYAHRLTVYQPGKSSLSVELKRLDISFSVNHKGYLHSHQLRWEIDPNQDAGTWYGLVSKLVLRNTLNPQERSILVPLGPAKYKRNDLHVIVKVANEGAYGRYAINSTLGRLDFAPEPRLAYLKILLHAYTSCVCPDPLTEKTGTEEALHGLRSAVCQPWTPLDPSHIHRLGEISKLTPVRKYYPVNMRVMQNVIWDSALSFMTQDDAFIDCIQVIVDASNSLIPFSGKNRPVSLETLGIHHSAAHLTKRARFRRRKHQRQEQDEVQAALDVFYCPRDRLSSSKLRLNVFEIVSILRDFPPGIAPMADLVTILHKQPTVTGFKNSYDSALISDLLQVNLPLEWGPLVSLCRTSDRDACYRLAFMFGLIAFQPHVDMNIVRTLLAHYLFDEIKSQIPPQWPLFESFDMHVALKMKDLSEQIRMFCTPFEDEESIWDLRLPKEERKQLRLSKQRHQAQLERECQSLLSSLQEQWPCAYPSGETVGSNSSDLLTPILRVSEAIESISPEWLRMYQNWELSEYVKATQQSINKYQHQKPQISYAPPRFAQVEKSLITHDSSTPALLTRLVRKVDAALMSSKHHIVSELRLAPLPDTETSSEMNSPKEAKELGDIARLVLKSKSPVNKRYGFDLMQSLTAFQTSLKSREKQTTAHVPHDQSASIAEARALAKESLVQIQEAFSWGHSRYKWLQKGGLWPCVSPISILELLRSASKLEYGKNMKKALVSYATSLADLQRLIRLQQAYTEGKRQRFEDEMAHLGHINWQPFEHPDWVLLELDGDFLIRPDQIKVAKATIAPASNSNSVLQMNMGQGKTSCIIPMASVDLADSKQLLTVVVPKALLLQTAQLMQTRVGGLVGRRILHVPFSRRTPTDVETTKAYFRLHSEIKASSGIVLTIPEHIMSFKLSGLQRISDNRIEEATEMVKMHRWLQDNSRQILDECDHALAVRTQLIYPSGPQTTFDGHPHRWETIESLLALVEENSWYLQDHSPCSIEVVRRPNGGFPMIFFLRNDAEDTLISRLVSDVVKGRLPAMCIQNLPATHRLALESFISKAVVQKSVVEQVDRMFTENAVSMKTMYLLRGLFVHRILLMTLKKRWNVQYGLHPSRDPIAVPYIAKGVPSEQAEWGHPDVAILLTCLAFYFGGISLSQLRQCVERLTKSDDPSDEYDRWAQTSLSLPGALREFNGINIDDELQLNEVWNHLRCKTVVINYFLNNFVFPKHAKQFQVKIQASAWDIPSWSPSTISGAKSKLTTGFSGTNDSKSLLPLNVTQTDLPDFHHTNAEVLTCLLHGRNRQYIHAVDSQGKRLTEIGILYLLLSRNIRILIDAGAQILEMDNKTLAEVWLTIDKEAKAAVYFDTNDKACVLFRKGNYMPLLASRHADDLSGCLVYLDEVHTRGTDLKLPLNAKGALTLGMGQTKDHTVQAAMRLRQLATTQSIEFLAPPEVHQSILHLQRKNYSHQLDSHDVVCWLLEQTCRSIEQAQPLHYIQGMDYCSRAQAALVNPQFLEDERHRNRLLEVLREEENRKLVSLYRPKPSTKALPKSAKFCPELKGFADDLHDRRKGFCDNGNAVHASALQEVEQEREVAFEVEAVREVHRPRSFSPLPFPGLHKDIFQFVQTGTLLAPSPAYQQVFHALRLTSVGLKFGLRLSSNPSGLFVSTEFPRSVRISMGEVGDVNYIRPVNWILWSEVSQSALVIIPEEVETIIPLLRNQPRPRTYLITYAAPVTRRMLHFNDLMYYTIPALPCNWSAPDWLKVELGLLGGRLYFDHSEYDLLCQYFGIENNDADRQRSAAQNSVTKPMIAGKPLAFLHEWLAARRCGQDFSQTPIGFLCQGKTLPVNHPFFAPITLNTTNTTDHTDGDAGMKVGGAIDLEKMDDEDRTDHSLRSQDSDTDHEKDNDKNVEDGGNEEANVDKDEKNPEDETRDENVKVLDMEGDDEDLNSDGYEEM